MANIENSEKQMSSMNKYLEVLEQAPGAVYIIDKNLNFEYINPYFTKLTGYTKEELLNKNIRDTLYKGEIPESRKELSESLARGERWQGELLTYHKSGETYWANTIASPYRDNEGNIESYIIIQQDITEHKKTETALSESEKLYRTLIESSLEGVAITKNSEIILFNKSFCRLFGYTHQEMLTKKPEDLVSPEDKDRIFEMHYKRMRGEIDNQFYKARFVRNDGTYFIAELNAATVQIDGENASFVTMRDITERELLQKDLEQSVTRFRDLADLLPQTIFEFDNNAILTFLNQEGKEKFIIDRLENNISAYSLIAPEDHERMKENLRKTNSENTLSRGNLYTAVKTNGERFPVMIFSSAIYLNGKVAGNRGIVIDLTDRIAMENALRESENKYKTLVENSQDGITIIRDNKILFANDTYCKMLGYTREELYNMPSVATLHPDEYEKALRIGERRRSQDFSTIYEVFNMLTKDGKVRECETTSSMIMYEGIWASFFTSHDITESKRMQMVIKESEEKYRLLFEAESDAIFMIDAITGQILDTNPAASRIYGFTKEEFLTMKNTDVSAEPEKTSLATKNNETLIPLRFHRKKNADIFPVELSAGFTYLNERKIQIVTARDITERVHNQEALRESEEKYRTLIEKALDGIVITQLGKFMFTNEAFCNMIHYTKEELAGKSYLDFVHPDDREVMINYHNRRMAGEDFQALYRSRLIRKDNKIITIEINARTTEYNAKPSAFIITRDITERLQIEKELQIAKDKLELLNKDLESRVNENSQKLAETRTQLIKLQKENLQSQFEVLKQQVNPHFLFNSLNVLTSLIKLEPDLAEKFSERLSLVYRYVLENKDYELVSLKTELDFLKAYIFLLDIRFLDKLKVDIRIPDDKLDEKIIPLAMQLLIENAIKHNTMSKLSKLKIDIYIDDKNRLNIVNNLQERKTQIISTGVGLKNIRNRYSLLQLGEPEFIKTDIEFIARIPLINN